jgi:iron complex outermembrane receptor protein
MRLIKLGAVSSIALGSMWGTTLHAQVPQAVAESSSGPKQATNAEGFGDIIVTAQRVEQRLQDVPAAISAISGESLANDGVARVSDLTARVPSLSVSRNLGVTNIYIRGIGNTFLNVGGDQSIAVHSNGVYIGRPRAQAIAFLDLDRVEVLRGPQGTLYGRNATGGAINIITRQPTDTFEGRTALSIGNYGAVRLEGALGGPVSESVSVRFSGMYARHNGYGQNIITRNAVDDLEELGVRGTLKFKPSSQFNIVLSAEYYNAGDRGNPWHYLGPGRSDTVPLGLRRGGVVPADIRDIASDEDSMRSARIFGASAIATWEVADHLTLKSISAYRESLSDSSSEADGTSTRLLRLDHYEKANQLSQELQATYSSGAITAVGGLFYFREKVAGSTLVRLLFVNPTAFGGSGPGEGVTDAYAAYGQLGVHITDKLTVTGALRYSYENRNTTGSSAGVALPFREAHWDAVTPKVIVDYKLNNDVMLYASASKGFKSGTFLIGNTNPVVNPENVWAYETGLKSKLFDRRVQLNISGFYYDYSDLQVSRVVNNNTLTENAAGATIKGIEVELAVKPWTGNILGLNGAYLDARFDSYQTLDGVRPELGILNLKGNKLPYSPDFSFSLRDEQSFRLGKNQFTVSADYAWTDDVFHDPFNLPSRGQKANGILNGRISLNSPDKGWSFGVWGRNLTDETVRMTTIVSVASVGYPMIGSLNDPRTFGVDASLSF